MKLMRAFSQNIWHLDISAPNSIYRDVLKVLPGTLLTFRVADGLVGDPDETKYFTFDKSYRTEIKSADEALSASMRPCREQFLCREA